MSPQNKLWLWLAALGVALGLCISGYSSAEASPSQCKQPRFSHAAPVCKAPYRVKSSTQLENRPARVSGGSSQPASESLVPASITMNVTVGWNGRYRASGAWVPIRVAVDNHGGGSVRGTVDVATSSASGSPENPGAQDVVYETSILILPQAVRHVTLYVPGVVIPNPVTVRLRVAQRTIASETQFPVPLDVREMAVGVLSGLTSAGEWVNRIRIPGSTVYSFPLSPTNLDSVPQALAGFDAIIATNVNTALLDGDQLSALEQYVRNGGTFIAVGGPDWQETLRPLPAVLLPGHLAGSTVTNSLRGLNYFGQGDPPPGKSIVSLLTALRGSSIGRAASGPLVVRSELGVGRLEYLAFDPGAIPLAHWSGERGLVTRLLAGVTPEAARRLALPIGFQPISFRDPGPGQIDPSQNSVGLPLPALPSFPLGLPLTLALLGLYILTLGPFGYVLLRRSGRRSAGWLAGPVMALIVYGLVNGFGPPHAGATAIVGSVGSVRLDGSGPNYPADSYMRVFAARSASPAVQFDSNAMLSAVPSPSDINGAGASPPLPHWAIRQAPRAGLSLPGLTAGSSRVVEMQTAVHINGGIVEHLLVSARGDIVGTIRNGTDLPLIDPVVIAGDVYERLPPMPPRSVVRIRIRPRVNVLNNQYTEVLNGLYGQAGGADGEQFRNAVKMLPEMRTVSMQGEVLLAGWTKQPLDAVSVNRVQPRRRALTLILKRLAVGFPSGTFQLRQGTIGAYSLDETPVRPEYACCNPSIQGIYMGAGGSATFEFDLPDPGRLHALSLSLAAFAGGPDTSYTGYTDMPAHTASVYDWSSAHWIDLTFNHAVASLPHPKTLISTTGAMLVRIHASKHSGDLAIYDPHHDLQLFGRLSVR